jgi:hypothetical protein
MGPALSAPAKPQALSCAQALLDSTGYKVYVVDRKGQRVRAERTRTVDYSERDNSVLYSQDFLDVELRLTRTDTALQVVTGGGYASRSLDPHVAPELSGGYRPPSTKVLHEGQSILDRCAYATH